MRRESTPNRKWNASRGSTVALCCLFVLAFASGSPGQTTPAEKPSAKEKKPSTVPKISAGPTVTQAKIDAKIKQIEANAMLKKEVKDQVLKLYNDAKEQLKAAEDFQKKLADYESLRNNVGKLTKEAQAELDKPVEQPDPNLPGNAKLSDFEALQANATAQRDKALDALQELEQQQKYRKTRQTEVPNRQIEAKKELADVQKKLAAKPAADEPPELVEARRTYRLARQQALEAEIKALDVELPTYKATDDLLQLQIRVASRRFKQAEKLVAFWTRHVERMRGNEADAQEREARDLLDELQKQGAPERLITLAEENLDMARRRTGPKGTVARIGQSVDDLAAVDKDLQQRRDDYDTLKEKLGIPGIDDVIGPQLLRLKRQLPNVGRMQRRIYARQRELSEVDLELLKDNKQIDTGDTDLDSRVDKLVESIAPNLQGKQRDKLSQWARRTLEQQKTLLNSLAKDHQRLYSNLAELNTKDQKLINEVRKLQQLIDKHILWIPSTSPLGLDDLRNSGKALLWLVSADGWKDTWNVLKASVFARPVISAFAIFLLALVLLKESQIKRQLREAGDQAASGFTEPYLLTVKALVLTLLLSAVWPCVLGFIGWHLESYPGAEDFPIAVANSLQAMAVVLFTLDFLRRMLRHHGLAEAHFRWRDARMQMFRSNLRWFAALALPGVFVLTMIEEWGNQEYSASLGRLTLMGELLVGSVFLALVLRRPRQRMPATASALDHTVAVKKAHFLRVSAFVVAVLFPVVLAVLAGAGYLYTAWLLTWKVTQTAWLAIGLVVVHALAMRWLYHARGRLALDRVQEAAATAAAVAAATETAAKPDDATSEPANVQRGDGKPPEGGAASTATSVTGSDIPTAAAAADREMKQKTAAEIATINAQTKRLLRMAVGSAAVIGLWLIWSDVLPALEFLQAPIMPSHIDGLTWGAAIVAVAVLVISFIAATNLPGLLEVAVLQKLPIDSGARYAASTTVRYLIYAIGIVWGFNIAGIDWSKIQWLVAALGVGIGFGLQDIVANFLSGLILLYERPLRVGDIITVGDVTGTVTRIQIRATTVRNWDQQEYVIPNKDLTTGRFINWTLSDSTNRVVINVGVAYGSDADLVQRILLETAKSCPDVLESPPPHAIFDGFGDSSLNFVLRCCLPSLDKRLPTMHYLHAEIHRRLAKAGIEIPFPQRDLHIRSDDTQRNGAFNGKKRDRESAEDYESASL